MQRAMMLMYFGLIFLLAASCQTNTDSTITLPLNCADGQVPKWNAETQAWECADDSDTTPDPLQEAQLRSQGGYITIGNGCVPDVLRFETYVGKFVTWRNDTGTKVMLKFGLRHPFGLGCNDPCEIPIEKDQWETKTAMMTDEFSYDIDGCAAPPIGPAWVIINQQKNVKE